jgi:hypothetical protein
LESEEELVFFATPKHHVGLDVGAAEFVHAPGRACRSRGSMRPVGASAITALTASRREPRHTFRRFAT